MKQWSIIVEYWDFTMTFYASLYQRLKGDLNSIVICQDTRILFEVHILIKRQLTPFVRLSTYAV